MKSKCLNHMNVEKALDCLYEAAVPNLNQEVVSAFYVIKEFITIIKEEAGLASPVPVLLRKKE